VTSSVVVDLLLEAEHPPAPIMTKQAQSPSRFVAMFGFLLKLKFTTRGVRFALADSFNLTPSAKSSNVNLR
jgi:hypothetical protein